MKRILVTGHKGYIGSVMAPYLARRGFEVVGTDTDYFTECTLVPGDDTIPNLGKDIRDLGIPDLRGFDAVVHLAALSNDPIGNMNADWTRDINLAGSVRVARLARAAGVRRFLFSSSCIMYGLSDAPVVNEDSPLDPRTEYARSKVEAEQAIAELANDRFSPTFLRNGTVYGLSPRMRLDTVLNDLVAAAITERRILIHGDGQPWRPVVHVEDVSQAFAAALAAPVEVIHNQAFNTGSDVLNIRVVDLAAAVADAVPGCRVEILGSPGADQRSYRAAFAKFARTFPMVRFRTPAEGARQLAAAMLSLPLTVEHRTSGRFVRLQWLRRLIDQGLVDPALRWVAVGAGR
jgi:nucleoside-diphosphate-sugar epimerase